MSRVKKLTIGSLASVVFACALFCTANFAFADENPLQKILDTVNSLYDNATIVNQDVYGVIADEYAVAVTDTTFGDGKKDSAEDIVKSDGNVKFHTSTALEKLEGDEVWSDYYFGEYGQYVGSDLSKYGATRVCKKSTTQWGLVNLNGDVVIDFQYDDARTSGVVPYASKSNGDNWDITFFHPKNYSIIKTMTIPKGYLSTSQPTCVTYRNFMSFYVSEQSGEGSRYIFEYNDGVLSYRDDITKLTGKTHSDSHSNVLIYKTDKTVQLITDDGDRTIGSFDSCSYMYFSDSTFTIYGQKSGEASASYHQYYLDGTSISDLVPSGYNLKATLDNGIIVSNYDINNPKTSFISKSGTTIKTIDVIMDEACGNYCFTKNLVDNDIIYEAYDYDLNYVKKVCTITKPSATYYSVGFSFVNGDAAEQYHAYKLSVGYPETSEQSNYHYDYYYFDNNLNSISDLPTVPNYVLLDGKKIYEKYDSNTGLYKYLGDDGNPVVINGYTLSTYQEIGNNNFSNTELRHGDEDIWWAVDANGKRGAIDTYGNVVVPFIYDRIRDNNYDDTIFAMGYKDGKWEFISTQSIPAPAPHVDSVTEDSVMLSWDAVEGADKYAVATKNADGSYHTYTNTLQETTYTITGLQPSTNYWILVQGGSGNEWSYFTDQNLVKATTAAHQEPGCPDVEATVGPNDGEITLSWDAIENATNYAAYEVVDGKFVQIGDLLPKETLTVTATDLACQVEHTFLVQAKVNGEWSSSSSTHFVMATPTGPVKPTLEEPVVSGTSIKLTWNKVPGATKYAVATKAGESKWTTHTDNCDKTTYTIKNLDEGIKYDCLVQAYVNGDWSTYTKADIKQATTQGTSPVVTATASGDGKVTLSWDAIESADKYAAYEVINGSFKKINEDIHETSIEVSNLANYYKHTFLVQSYVDGVWSKFSEKNYVSATPEGTVKPLLYTPEVEGTTLNFEWESVPGAACYAVATRPQGQSNWDTYTLTCTDLTYSVTNLEESLSYECLVQANVNGKWSAFDDGDIREVVTEGIRPIVTATPNGDGKVKLEWDEIDGADKYAAYEVVNGNFVAISENIPAGTCTITKDDLANGYKHAFLVQAHVGDTWSKFDERNYAYATPTGTVKPTLNEPQVTGTSIKLTWNKVPGANRYAIATRTETSGYVTHSYSVTDTEFTIAGLEDSTKYYCLVQANINGKWSDFTRADEQNAITKGTRPVVNAEPSGDGQVTLSWAAIENADKYVAYEVVNGNYDQIGDFMPAGTTSKVVTNLGNGYEHTFLVQAQVGGVWSKFSKDNYATATPTGTVKPTLQTPVVSGSNVSLTWNAVPGATRYAVATKYEVGNSYTTYTYDATGTEYTIQGLQQGIKYYCLVQAEVNGNWSSFDSSDLKVAAVEGGESPIVYANPTASGQVTLTWNSIPDAKFYLAYEYKDGKYVNIPGSLPQGTTSLVVDDLANEKPHVFLVQAFVNQHYSSFSQANLASATPTGPVKPTFRVDGTSADSVTVSWDSVPGATEYAAAVREPSGKYISLFLDKNARSATIGGLDAGTDYYALVQCKIDGVWSAFTETDHIKATTVVGAPSAKAVVKDKVMTFYYDGISHKAPDTTVYWVPSNPQSYTEIPWIVGTGEEGKLTVNVTNVIIDSSYAQYRPTSLNYMFAFMNQAVAAPVGCENINTSEVTSMSYTFSCYGATGYTLDNSSVPVKQTNGQGISDVPNVANWDTSKVTNMHRMFDCYGATSTVLDAVPDVSNWDTSNVTDFSTMFWCYGGDVRGLSGSTVLSKVPNVTNWNTSKGTTFTDMFTSYGANSQVLNAVPNVSNWNTAKVKSMDYTFEGFGYSSKVLDCVPNVTNWNTSVCETFYGMFATYGNNSTVLSKMPDVSKWNTALATKSLGTGLGGFTRMFAGYGKSSTKDLAIDLRSFTVNSAFSNMFENCAALKTIYCNKDWTSYGSYSVFTGCNKLVGGAGTTYSADKISGVYARVDKGTTNPGYFTTKA